MKTVRVKATVQIPRVPNFLMMKGEQKVPIAAVSDEELEEIGKEWTLELINRARYMRRNTQAEGT